MKRVPYVSILLENAEGEILLSLRDNRSATTCSKHWTLIGGNMKDGETPELAARRKVEEEIGSKIDLTLWKRYDREHPLFIIDQYIYVGKLEDSRNLLILGRDTQFFKPCEVRHLNIGYGFCSLLDEYFLLHKR